MKIEYKGRTFSSDKIYYQYTWFDGPVLMKMKVVKTDPKEWDFVWGFYEYEHVIPSTLPLGGYLNPEYDWTIEDRNKINDFILDPELPGHKQKIIKAIFSTREDYEEI